jgi:tetrahydromethanopterin S-methyltransferase subunit G
MIMELQLHLEMVTQSKLDDIEKKIPITNEELLKEVQKMRDDFFALRQNL